MMSFPPTSSRRLAIAVFVMLLSLALIMIYAALTMDDPSSGAAGAAGGDAAPLTAIAAPAMPGAGPPHGAPAKLDQP